MLAVVARGMGTCCVAGCGVLRVSEDKKILTLPDGTVLTEGDYVSLNGSTGEVFAQKIKTVPALRLVAILKHSWLGLIKKENY